MSNYVGDTPWKKLKKLYHIGRSIIFAHGFRYFIYVMKLELKKQGLSMFVPDDRPVPIYDQKSYQEKYNTYLETMNSNLEYSKNKSYNTKLNVITVFFNHNSLQTIVNSLNEQTYKHWTLKIISSAKMPDSVHEFAKNNSSISIFDDVKSLGDTINDENLNIFVDPGTKLSKYCLSKLVDTFNENPNYDIFYFDHDYLDEYNAHSNPFFKPDWSKFLFYSMNYLSPMYAIRNSVMDDLKTTKFSSCFTYDVLLHALDKTDNVYHIALPLCSVSENIDQSVDCKKKSLQSHLTRVKSGAIIENGIVENTFRIRFPLYVKPKVSIIIPTKNNHAILKRCLDNLVKKTNYKNYEIIIIDNPTKTALEKDTIRLHAYYESLPYKIITYNDNFNFSKMNNLAVNSSSGELLLFLNDDTKVIDPNWLDELVSIILQNNVGIVGPKLIYSDDTIQHGGMTFLKTGSGFHPSVKEPENSLGYHGMLNVMRNYSAVTGACLLIHKEIFEKVEQFDEQFDVYYGDSDLCLKVLQAGYDIVYTPFTKLIHEGSFSIRGSGASFFAVENHNDFVKKWPYLMNGDPYYNPNLDWNYDILE